MKYCNETSSCNKKKWTTFLLTISEKKIINWDSARDNSILKNANFYEREPLKKKRFLCIKSILASVLI